MIGGEERAPMPLSLPGSGDVLAGKYRLGETLGAGGMGVVVAGEHIHLEQPIAVKMLLPHVALMPGARDRFVREARAAAKIPGDHAVRILDVDATPEGIAYMIMERLEGADLGALLAERGRLEPVEAVDLILQGLAAVAAAHAAGIVHRDLKPSNLFVARGRDGRTLVKVLDFGISKTLSASGDASQTLTDPNAPIGSPQYMAPEQITDARSVDARADIWSVGVMLYELIAGQAPFEAASISHLYVKILHEPAPPLPQLRRGVPPGLVRVIEACLAKDRNERVQTAEELRAMLLPFASPRARAQWAARDDADAPSVPAVVASLRIVPATSDVEALGQTMPASPSSPRRRRGLVAAAAGVLAGAALLFLGLQSGSTGTAQDVSSTAESAPASTGPAVVPGPSPEDAPAAPASATASAAASAGAAAPPVTAPSAPSAPPARPAVRPAAPAPSPAPTTTAKVKDLRDIRPLE